MANSRKTFPNIIGGVFDGRNPTGSHHCGGLQTLFSDVRQNFRENEETFSVKLIVTVFLAERYHPAESRVRVR